MVYGVYIYKKSFFDTLCKMQAALKKVARALNLTPYTYDKFVEDTLLSPVQIFMASLRIMQPVREFQTIITLAIAKSV